MATLQLQKYLERNTIKHPTALLHFKRQLSDFEQGILFLCVHIIAKTARDTDGFYYLNKSLVRAVMRQENNQDYARINEAVDRVSETKLKLNFWGEDRTFDDYEAPLIIGKATSKRRGTIAFEVHPRLEQVIKDPRVFARLNIHFIAALADVHRGYAFYALFKDAMNRQRDPETLEETYDYWELRSYLGVDDGAYPVFKEFKKYVLKPLIDAVKDRTDLHLSYEPVKTGRTLTHLKFTIKPQAWQLQLFEAEHAARLVAELAKNFDGAVIESKATASPIEGGEDKERADLIDLCVKMGVTSSTVERALAAYGIQGVGEIIDYTKKQFAKKDKKGESYETKHYLAKMLNEGVGVKTAAARQKDAAAKQKLEERAAARAAQMAAEQEEEALKARFSEHQKERAQQLWKKKSPSDLAKLSEAVGRELPDFADYRRRWNEVDQDYTRLDLRKMTDKTIRGWVVQETLKLWGEPEDLEFETYKKRKSAIA